MVTRATAAAFLLLGGLCFAGLARAEEVAVNGDWDRALGGADYTGMPESPDLRFPRPEDDNTFRENWNHNGGRPAEVPAPGNRPQGNPNAPRAIVPGGYSESSVQMGPAGLAGSSGPCGAGSCSGDDSCGGCGGDDGCGDYCVRCNPCWTLRADAVFLSRSKPSCETFLCDTNGAKLADAHDFNLGWSTGWDIDLIRHDLGCGCWGLEGRYLGMGDWSTSRMLCSNDGAVIGFKTPVSLWNPQNVCMSYTSRLNSAELNLRREWCDGGCFLIGFRYFDLTENGFSIDTSPVGGGWGASSCQVGAANNMVGLQFGVENRFWCWGRLALDGVAKVGVYDNHVRNSASVYQPGGPQNGCSQADGYRATVGMESQVTGVFDINPCCSWRTGFELLWLDGVATAPWQIPASDPLNGCADIHATSSVLYTGLFTGIEFRR